MKDANAMEKTELDRQEAVNEMAEKKPEAIEGMAPGSTESVEEMTLERLRELVERTERCFVICLTLREAIEDGEREGG